MSETHLAAGEPIAPLGPALQLRGVTKRFGRGAAAVTALADVSLEVNPGERLVVLGPTGAGKTTLLRVIAGLETPDAGELFLAGEPAAALAPADRDVALVFQNFSLYPHLTVRGNLEFPLRAPGRSSRGGRRAPPTRQEIAERVEQAAAMLRIGRLLDRPAKHLSGGEMQRVAIGRAIVRRPKLFLLDEPLTNLDAKLREALRVELVALFRQLGVPVVYVTHDQAEALSIGDRIVVLAAGRVLQAGTPRDVYLQPATPEVARQLGQPQINLVAVEQKDGAWRAADGIALLAADAPAAATLRGATKATLGIRPEHLSLSISAASAAAPGTLPISAVIELVEPTGPASVVVLHAGATKLHATVPPQTHIAPGSAATLTIDPSRARMWA